MPEQFIAEPAIPRVHFETLGCRLNQDESEGAAFSFSNAGFAVDMEAVTATSPHRTDTVLCVLNTCTVTGKAEQKARRIIRMLLQIYPASVIIVTGCYAELDGEALERIAPERIISLPGRKKHALSFLAQKMKNCAALDKADSFSYAKIKSYLEAFSFGAEKTFLSEHPFASFSLFTPVFQKHSRATLKIQDGCNSACTFCRIHLARGKSVSLNMAEAVRRAKAMEDSGVHEIVLTGVNLGQYAFEDTKNTIGLSGLLSALLESTKLVRFRLSSLYPQCIDKDLCSVLQNERVQPFFHLSIQSGSERILSLMHRPHSVAQVERAVTMLREVKDNPFVSADIIAGFPSETDEDFLSTTALCSSLRLAWIHAFPYSPRPGTPAATFSGQVIERIKKERVARLTALAVEGKTSYIQEWQGRKLFAVVEKSREQRLHGGSVIHAVTDNFLHVECPLLGSSPRAGESVFVRITDVASDSLNLGGEVDCYGELCSS